MKDNSTRIAPKRNTFLWFLLLLTSVTGVGIYSFYGTQQSQYDKKNTAIFENPKIKKQVDTHFSEKQSLSTEKTYQTVTTMPILTAGIDREALAIAENQKAYSQYILAHPYSQPPTLTREQIKAMPKRDRPDLALQQEFLKTLDPKTHTIPSERLVEARKQTQEKLRKKDKAGIPGVTWTERGPSNVGGRTRALMFDPNDATRKKVWAGGVAGGVWFNNDITSSTISWQRIDDFWSNMAVTSIAYAPNATQTFYAGTGEGFGNLDAVRGGGIWKTINGGTTWNVLTSTQPTGASGSQFKYVQKIVVNSSGVIFVATDTGIMRSLDGGLTWLRIFNTRSADVELASNDDLYVGTFTGAVQRSINPTVTTPTFTAITPTTGGSRVEIAIAASESSTTATTTLYAIAGNGQNIAWFKKSTNGGTSWTDCTIPRYREQNCSIGTTHFTRGQSWYDLILAVRPNDPNVVIAGGVDVHSTSDGGTTWTNISYWTGSCASYVHADIHAIEFRPNNLDQLIIGNDGGVSYSNNAGDGSGSSFAERIKDYNVTQFYACAMNNTSGSNVYLAGAQDNGTNRFSNAGINATTEVRGGDGAFCFIDQDNPNLAISSYVYNTYALSTNGGINFTTTLSNNQTKGDFINPADYDSDENILYSAGDANEVLRISGIGGTPSSQQSFILSLGGGSPTAIRADAFTTGRIFVGTNNGGIYRVDDAHTANPTATGIGGSISGYVSCIDIGANDNELLVTLSNYGVKSVYYTSNGGTTWTSKDETIYGLPDMPVRWALFNPNNFKQVMIATELGVWSAEDITLTNPGWEPSNTGLSNVRCDMLQYRTSDKQVAIATHGRGLFTTTAFAAPVVVSANYTATPKIGYENMNFTFTDASTAATSYNWNFGAGATPATATTKGAHTVAYSNYGWKASSLNINAGASAKNLTANAVLPYSMLNYLPANGGDFETDNGHFIAETVTTGFAFQRGNSAVAGKNGTAGGTNAWVTALAGNYPDNATAILYTPSFNFGATGNYTFEFKAKYVFENNYDGFIVEYSTNKGSTWTQLGNTVEANWYNGTKLNSEGFATGTPFFTGTTGGVFSTFAGNVNFLAGNAQVAFRFVFKSDGSTNDAGVAIDDFKITAPLSNIAFSPLHNATGVLPDANLSVTFNRNITKDTGNVVIKRALDNTIVETIAVTDAKISVSNAVATINPTNNLAENTAYYIEIGAGTFRDIDLLTFGGFSGNNIWAFTTGDVSAPMLTALSPANNTTSIIANTNLVMTFNENVKKGASGNITIKKLTDNTVVETIAITNAIVAIVNNVVTINPASDLAYSTDYYVEVNNGAIQDVASNNFVGLTGNTSWKFKTDLDNILPAVVTFNPAHNSVNFPGANNLVITFSEAVKKGTTGTVVIRKVSDNTTVESFNILDATITIASAVVTINPTADFAYDTDLYVEISNGAVQDLAGNNYAGFSGASTWKFKTDFSTSVENNSLAKVINLYPNPVIKNAMLQINEGVLLKDVQLRMLDMKGVVIWQQQMPTLAEKQAFDWGMLPAGKYILEVKTKQGTANKQVIKQ